MDKKFMYSLVRESSSWCDNIPDAAKKYSLTPYLAGKLLTVYRGVYRESHHTDFINDVWDAVGKHMQKNAYFKCDDISNANYNYLYAITDEKAKDLENYILKWVNENCPQPPFYVVDDIQEIKVRVKQIGKDIEYEVIEG